MKKKIVPIIILLSILSLLFVKIIQNKSVYAGDAEVYDVILFWGQSNMQGYMSLDEAERFDPTSAEEVENFSKATGIDTDILYNTTSMSYVKIEQQPSTVYEYKYLTNNLEELSSSTQKLGENLTYNATTGKLEAKTSEDKSAAQQSVGINMIPEFCKTYYERTGRKVVAVMCAVGGQRIETFLPVDDEDYVNIANTAYYVYEGMVEKYQSAISYLEDNGYTVGNKLWVSCQGEANVSFLDPAGEYARLFTKVHNNLKNDLGITKGALVETARIIGTFIEETELMHEEQELIIESNDDIILGSSYLYERYIPDETTYESDEYFNENYVDSSGNKLSYSEAYTNASYSVCSPNNMIHFTSAALSQVGREAATAFTEAEEISIISNPTKTNYIQNYEELNLEGGKLSVKFNNGTVEEIDMTDSMVEVSGFDNTKTGTNTVNLTVRGKTVGLDLNIVPKSLMSISVKQVPSKTEYIQNYEKLNLSGGSITLKYDDQTTEVIEMTNNDVKVTGFDNTTLGSKQLTVTYEGKTATFSVEIIEKSLTGIEIKELPTKTKYIQNYEKLNLAGGSITLKYDDNTTEELDMTHNDVTVTGFTNTTLGSKTLTVTYQGKTATFTVNIVEKSLTGIEIKELPTKTKYTQNYEELNLTGGSITLKYDDNTTEELAMTDNNVTVTGFNNTTLGSKTLTVTYQGKTATFTVNIVEKTLTGIEIKELPSKTEYIQNYGELNLAGGSITLKYDDNTTEEIAMTHNDVKVTGFDNSTVGEIQLTVTYQGKTATFSVKIIEKGLTGIEIKKLPTKTEYIQNYEELNLAGGSITLKYDDNTTEELAMTHNDVKVTGFDNTTTGTKQLTVTYQGKTATFTINIVEKSLTGIEIKELPTKTEYIQNYENLNLTGGSITLKYNDNTTEELDMTDNDVKVTGFDNSTVGEIQLTITYQGKTTAFTVDIVEKSLTGIEIKKLPTKTEYIQNYKNEQLDLTGGIITVSYNDETTEELDMTNESITVTGFDNGTVGEIQLIVTYRGKKATFTIDIVEKSLTGIEVKELPTKTEYIEKYEKEQLDLTGGIILLKYNNETTEELDMKNNDVKVTGFDNSTIGEKEITVTYQGKTTAFTIKIVEKEVEGIQVKQKPVKTEYIQNHKNEKLDLAGGIITVNYNDETTEELEMTNESVEVTGFSNSTVGEIQLTVTYANKTATFSIEIIEKSLTGIEVKDLPIKTEYIENHKNEELDLTGGVITLNYNNETTEELDMTNENIAVTGFDNSTVGEIQLTVTYANKTATFSIEIIEKSLTGIEIKELPTKTQYIVKYEKEQLDLTGGIILLKYNNETTEELEMTHNDVKVTGFDNSTIGEIQLSVTYQEKTATFTIEIVEKEVQSIQLKQLPVKTEYIENYKTEQLDLTGGIITANYNDETADDIEMTSEKIKVTGFDNSRVGEIQLTVTYQGKTTTFAIDIIEKSLIGIEVKELPVKTEYIENYKAEKLDLTGGSILLRYNNETIEELSMTNKNVEVTGFDNSQIGKIQLTVTYKGQTDTFTVDIVEKSLVNIEIKELPNKLQYIKEYEQLDLNGGTILVLYNNQTTEELEMTSEEVEVTGFDNSTLGEIQLTVTYKGQTAIFKVDIVEKSIIEIKVKDQPKKLEYIQNYEELDLSGGTILVLYDNETTEEIDMNSPNAKVTGFDNSKIGKQIITINYGEKTATFTVEIIKKSVVEIEIKNKPLKLEYIVGNEKLELNEATILVTYNDKTTQEIELSDSNVEITGFDSSKIGKQTITIKYGGKSTTFQIEVRDKSIIEIQIKSMPSKLEYIQNFEKLNLAGGILFVKYDNGTTEEIKMSDSNVEVTGFDNSKIGKQTITVKYGKMVETFEIEIINKSIVEIEIKKLPNKLTYIMKEEKLDLSNGEIIVKYNDNTKEVIKMEDKRIKVSGFDNSKKGKKIIQIMFGEKITNFEIEVVEREIIKDNSENIDNTVTKNEIPNAGNKALIYIAVSAGICLAIFFKRKSDKIQIK